MNCRCPADIFRFVVARDDEFHYPAVAPVPESDLGRRQRTSGSWPGPYDCKWRIPDAEEGWRRRPPTLLRVESVCGPDWIVRSVGVLFSLRLSTRGARLATLFSEEPGDGWLC